jgi:hypothetical protein
LFDFAEEGTVEAATVEAATFPSDLQTQGLPYVQETCQCLVVRIARDDAATNLGSRILVVGAGTEEEGTTAAALKMALFLLTWPVGVPSQV